MPCTVFAGSRCLAVGPLKDVALIAKTSFDESAAGVTPIPVLIFDDATSDIVELDWRGTDDEFAARFELRTRGNTGASEHPLANALDASPPDEATPNASERTRATVPRGPGRPKLGVVAREVTLLPRHWEWLGTQSGGASVALRKLVEVARRACEVKDRIRLACAVGYKFMATMAGHERGFEEASRALFAGDQAGFEALISAWPRDVQTHLKKILVAAFLERP